MATNDSAIVKAKLLQSDIAVTSTVLAMAEEICKQEGISLHGLTILGGKPYINVVGLDQKVANLCKEREWIKCGQELRFISEEADVQSRSYRCGFYATISFFDQEGYLKALGKVTAAGPVTEGVLAEIRKQFTFTYSDEGWAGDASVKMSTMKNRDFLRMMASRRASNRAKRAATGCGLTSVDEMEVDTVSGDAKTAILDAETVAAVKGPPAAPQPQERLSYTATWRDKDGFSFTAPKVVEEQRKLKDLATWMPKQKVWMSIAACQADVQALFEEFGYELVVPEAPKAGPEPTPSSGPAQGTLKEQVGF